MSGQNFYAHTLPSLSREKLYSLEKVLLNYELLDEQCLKNSGLQVPRAVRNRLLLSINNFWRATEKLNYFLHHDELQRIFDQACRENPAFCAEDLYLVSRISRKILELHVTDESESRENFKKVVSTLELFSEYLMAQKQIESFFLGIEKDIEELLLDEKVSQELFADPNWLFNVSKSMISDIFDIIKNESPNLYKAISQRLESDLENIQINITEILSSSFSAKNLPQKQAKHDQNIFFQILDRLREYMSWSDKAADAQSDMAQQQPVLIFSTVNQSMQTILKPQGHVLGRNNSYRA